MKQMMQKPRLTLIQEIPLSPLLLVLLVLVIALLTLLTPQTQTSAPQSEQVITLSIDAQRGLRLAEQQLTLAELPAALQAALLAGQSMPPAVLVQPHPDLPVQHLLEVMQALRTAGIQRTAVAPAP